MRDIVKGVIVTVIALGVVSVIKKISYDDTNIHGKWAIETTVEKTTYKKYKGMKLEYNLLLNQNGTIISGTGERVAEITTKGKKTYAPKNRSNVEIKGNIEKRCIGKDIIHIYFDETYSTRPTSTMLKFYYSDKDMNGEYSSTAADQSGSATLKKGWN